MAKISSLEDSFVFASVNNTKIKYRRILLKISGETLGQKSEILTAKSLNYITEQIVSVYRLGIKIGVVVGGGNIIRGRDERRFDRIDADYCGMVSTVINGMTMYSYLKNRIEKIFLRSSFEIAGIVPQFNKFEDKILYDNGGVLILVGGTGNPTVSTDTAAAIRAVELSVDVLIKGTNVEGVYSQDPKKNKKATLFEELGYDQVIKENLNVMDITAFKICKDAKIPICVYNLMKYPLIKIVSGKRIGTIVH